jgi:hypothetical protein
MIQPPKPFKFGPKKLRKLMDERDKFAKTTQVLEGPGFKISEIENQGRKGIVRRGGGGGGDSDLLQFYIDVISDELGNKQISLNYGEVNGDPPSDMPTDFSPLMFSPGSGTQYVYLKVETDDTTLAVTDVTCHQGGSIPDNEDFVGYYAVGIYVSDADGVRVVSRNPGPVAYINGNAVHYFGVGSISL